MIERVEGATQFYSLTAIAEKKDSSLRISVDYPELNSQIVRKLIITLAVEESLEKLVDACVFSNLDANDGYWWVPLAPASRERTNFITPVERYIFCRPPFETAAAPQFFQR